MKMYYINSRNEKVDLMSAPYMTRTTDMFNYEWSFDKKNDIINRIYKETNNLNVEIDVFASTKDNYYTALNRLTDIFDYDIVKGVLGRMYVNDYYINCNVIASEKSEWESGYTLLKNKLTILAISLNWLKEKETIYAPSRNDFDVSGNKKYSYTYPYTYGGTGGTSSIDNPSSYACDCLIRVYGPISSPGINIGGNIYNVKVDIADDERVEIKTSDRSIFLIKNDGTIINIFNYRDTEHYVFKKIPSGTHDVIWNDGFKFDIVLYQERSEPEWRGDI